MKFRELLHTNKRVSMERRRSYAHAKLKYQNLQHPLQISCAFLGLQKALAPIKSILTLTILRQFRSGSSMPLLPSRLCLVYGYAKFASESIVDTVILRSPQIISVWIHFICFVDNKST